MRIASLHLKAYGPFNGAIIDFDRGPSGLHLVYGPNEHGKSTAMRAITALLFGFPVRTDDHFGRDYSALRVGAVLADDKGSRAVMRRKGARQTLFEFDLATGREHPERLIDQASIDALLGGVDARRFDLMHSLGSAQLRLGGRSLLESASELGATLFEAASGIQRLRAISASLQAQADALFVPRGKLPLLNAALIELDASQQAARDAAVAPRQWQTLRGSLDQSQADLLQIETQWRSRRARLAEVQRLLSLGPQVARSTTVARELSDLADVPELADDAQSQLAVWLQSLEQTGLTLIRERDRLSRCREALAALPASTVDLDAAQTVAQLAGRLDAFRVACASSARLQSDASAAQRLLPQTLGATTGTQLPPSGEVSGSSPQHGGIGRGAAVAGVDTLVPSRAAMAQARRVLGVRRDLETRRTELSVASERSERALIQARSALEAAPDPGDITPFVAAHDAATAVGDIEQQASRLASQLVALETQLDRQAEALGGPSADVLARLSLPGGLLDEAQSLARTIVHEQEQLRTRQTALLDALDRMQREHRGLSQQQGVIARSALEAARAERDGHLQRLQTDSADASRALRLALLGESIGQADRLADARFHDAVRLAEIDSLQLRIAEAQQALAACEIDGNRLAQRAAQAAQEWAYQLASRGLPAVAPQAWSDWSAHHQRLLEALAARDALATEHRSLLLQHDHHLSLLQSAYAGIAQSGPSLPSLSATLRHARSLMASLQQAEAERRRLADVCEQALREEQRHREALATVDREAESLRTDWQTLAGELRLDASASSHALAARLDAFDDLRDASTAFETADRQWQLAAEQIDSYRADTRALAHRLGKPEPAPGVEAAFIAACRSALESSQRAHDDRLRLQTEVQSLEQSIALAQAQSERLTASIAGLQTIAGVPDAASLQRVVSRSDRRRELRREAASLDVLIRGAAGSAYASLVEQIASVDPVALQTEQETLEQLIAQDESARDAAIAARTHARSAFDAVNGDARAALAAESSREHLAGVARLATDWARLRLARELLERSVQTYQTRSQGPMLTAASRWFSRMTAGRWAKLLPDWSGDDQILIAERDDGLRLPVARLSEGTADALYLSLRLAAIEVRLDAAPAIPLLLDDVLMTFDDERAVLALQGLAEFAQRNQVVYFTHHPHLLELARDALPGSAFSAHELTHGPPLA
jgi:DNA repair protein SbcC/Rad50